MLPFTSRLYSGAGKLHRRRFGFNALTNTFENSQIATRSTPQAVYFGADGALFGQLHCPDSESNVGPRQPAVVICNPLGFEYIRSYRAIRHVAEQLCDEGHCTLRFDYQTTGDSAGTESDVDRLKLIVESIDQAIAFARSVSGSNQVVLIGLRLGANLAARVAERTDIAGLVLWAPCDSGAIFVREQQIMAAAQSKRLAGGASSPNSDKNIDAGGFYLTPEIQGDLQNLKLGTDPFPSAPQILVLNRDDIKVQPRLVKALEAQNSKVTVGLSHAYKEMMLPPQLSAVPTQAIDSIREWMTKSFDQEADNETSATTAPRPTHSMIEDGIREDAIRFGPDGSLFGIISQPQKRITADFAVVLLCGGAPHRISANGMYVTIARRLARCGIPSIRLDLSGIGDSLPRPGCATNKPYTDVLGEDVAAAMNAVEEICDVSQFKLFGLCSGAYAATQAATSDRVIDLVLANQLLYYLTGDELESLASGDYRSAHELDFPRSKSPVYKLAVKILKKIPAALNWPGEWLSQYLIGGPLNRDLKALAARGIRISFVQSSRDSAVDALHIAAGRTVRQLIRTGDAQLQVFDGTDHTFSPRHSQQQLTDWLVDHFQSNAPTS